MPDAQIAPKYRPDIDGLRAIAVISVVGFHAFPQKFPGGFVGVDVFFVISGFLITQLILLGLQKDTFSFSGFYARRARRILPALLLVVAASCAFGWFALFSNEYSSLGKHAVAAVAFFENFLLWSESGYFDISSELKPFTHIWSLAVEEQFYLLYPFVLWLAWKARLNLPFVISAIVAVSFCLSILELNRDPTAAFFLPQYRFWELLSGGLLVYISIYRERLAPLLQNCLPAIGLTLIVVAIAKLNRNSLFPGWFALLPVVGTMLIILGGPRSWINQNILSNRLAVAIGLISYPIYLWHWPLLSFARIVDSAPPGPMTRTIAVFATIVLAWLSYRLVEVPLRFGPNMRTKISLLGAFGVVLVGFGIGVVENDGLPKRRIDIEYGEHVVPDYDHSRFQKYIADHFFECGPKSLRDELFARSKATRCAQSEPSELRATVIIGDSHGENLFIGLAEEENRKEGIAYYLFYCLPFYGLNGTASCQNASSVIDYVVADPHIKTIIIATSASRLHQPNVRLTDKNSEPLVSTEIFERALDETLAKLTSSNKKIYIADDTPSFPFDPVACLKPRPFGKDHPIQCSFAKSQYFDSIADYQASVNKVSKRFAGVTLLDLGQYFCNEVECSMTRNGELLFRDRDHLSIEGSKFLGKQIAGQIFKD